jgi:NitT/TauT family transport system substrate-binding protein
MTRILFAALALCFLGAPGATAADQLTFQLGWLPGGERAPAFLALEKGLFAAENLDVKILGGRGSTDVLTRLGTGSVDIGEVTMDVYLYSRAEGSIPVTAVMPFFTKQMDSLVTTTSSGIVTLKDTAGRTIGTTPTSGSNEIWPIFLKMNGVDPAKVNIKRASSNVLPGMLATGQADGVLLMLTTAPGLIPLLASAGKQIKVITWAEYGYEGYSQTIVATNKVLAERPDVVRRFLKVLRQAMLLTQQDPDAAARAVHVAAPQAELSAIRAQIDASVPMMFNEITQRDGLGVFSSGHVRKTWEWAARARNYALDRIDPLSTVSDKYSGS